MRPEEGKERERRMGELVLYWLGGDTRCCLLVQDSRNGLPPHPLFSMLYAPLKSLTASGRVLYLEQRGWVGRRNPP